MTARDWSRRSDLSYAELVRRIAVIVRGCLPAGATVAVVSKGDDTLLDLPGLDAWHFPRDPSGAYSGFHPATSDDAVDHLEDMRRRGAEYLVLPRTAFWWLQHYAGFARHLERRCQVVVSDRHCAVYRLGRRRILPLRRPRPPSRARAATGCAAGRVSLVVTSHDKGPWLAEALGSLATQTVPPYEVIVVDDASTDATAEIAEHAGARYVHVDYHSPSLARNHGARLAAGELLCFLDGDDRLAADFLERHLEALGSDPRAGFAYGRVREFGQREYLWPTQPWDSGLLRRRNYVPAASVVRASAFRQVGGFPDLTGAEDWGLWLRLSAAGWDGTPCDAAWWWRRHTGSRNATRTWAQTPPWAEEAPLECMSVAIFSALAGKHAVLDEWLETLQTITWPRQNVELWLYDNSCDPVFHRALLDGVATLEGFRAVHIVRDDEKVHDELREYEALYARRDTPDRYQEAWLAIADQVARIYTWAAATVRADLCVLLEDDVVPVMGGSFLEALVAALDWEVDAVYGWYPSRLGNLLVVEPPADGQDWDWRTPLEPETGIAGAAGGGLGCVLFRGDVFRGRTFTAREPLEGPDLNLSRELWSEGRVLRCNWDVECRHLVELASAGGAGQRRCER